MSKYLVFVRSGRALPLCLKNYQAVPEIQLVISAYEPIEYACPEGAIYIDGHRSKFESAYYFFLEHSRYLDVNYAAFFDPDLDIAWQDVRRLFEFGEQHQFELFQPALTEDSYATWPHTYRVKNSEWRKTNFVEVMAPFMSKNLLNAVWRHFTDSISTWGLEFIWIKQAKRKPMAIIDAIPMTHTSPIDIDGGKFYQYLNKVGVNWGTEKRKLKRVHVGPLFVPCALPGFMPASLAPEWTVFVFVLYFPVHHAVKLVKKLRASWSE